MNIKSLRKVAARTRGCDELPFSCSPETLGPGPEMEARGRPPCPHALVWDKMGGSTVSLLKASCRYT